MDSLTVKERKEAMHQENNSNERIEKKTFWRQIVFNGIFISENILFILLVQTRIPAIVPRELFYWIIVGHSIGIFFDIIYYNFFHVWKHTFDWKARLNVKECPTFTLLDNPSKQP